MGKSENIRWHKSGDVQWTSSVERTDRQATIDFTAPGTYTLTVTGTGAPAPADYNTLKIAKKAFQTFLFDKSET
jgi:hypothetical protein